MPPTLSVALRSITRPPRSSGVAVPSWKERVLWLLENLLARWQAMPHGECPMALALKEDREVRGMEAVVERPDGTFVHFVPYPTPLYDGSVHSLVL